MYFLPINLSLSEFLLHWGTKNMNLSKSRHWVSDSNLKTMGSSPNLGLGWVQVISVSFNLNLSTGLVLKCILQADWLVSCLLPEIPAVSLLSATINVSFITIGQKVVFLLKLSMVYLLQ